MKSNPDLWPKYFDWQKKRMAEYDAEHGCVWRAVKVGADGWGWNNDCPIVQRWHAECNEAFKACKL